MLAATYAITARMTVDDLADTWAPYLTMAESLAHQCWTLPQPDAHLLLCLRSRCSVDARTRSWSYLLGVIPPTVQEITGKTWRSR